VDLEAVYQLLGERSRGRTADASASGAHAALPANLNERSDAKDDVWTEDLLERIAQGDTISTQVLTDIMDVIARDPHGSHEYNREELVEETGHSAGRVTATFTKLTPHFRKHYGTEWWPIIGQSGASFDPVRQGTYYWMAPAIADRWKRIRNL
jgi:hypothetical protein